MRHTPYTVVEQKEVVKLLNLDTAPTGITVIDSDKDSVIVKTIPPQESSLPFYVPEYDSKIRGFNVSKDLLQDAWNKNLIKKKTPFEQD